MRTLRIKSIVGEYDVKVEIDLPNETAEKLERQAQRLHLPAEQLARIAVAEFLRGPEEDFARAAQYVLEKNQELLKGLS